jgi:Zn-dependent protease with chaperone function
MTDLAPSAGFLPNGVWIAASLTLALLAPVLASLWLRARALAAPREDIARVWFGFARRMQGVGIASWLLWIAAFSLSGADRALAVALRPFDSALFVVAPWFAIVLPPTLVSLVLQAIVHDVQRRVRGAGDSVRDHVRRSAWQLAALLVPMLLALIALPAFLTGHARVGLVFLVGALFSRLRLMQHYVTASGLSPHAVTSGALRDRLFDLAQRGGVPLRQLYIMPVRRGRIANAFAVQGGSVILTDYLLENLSEREVVAVMAHEIGHLRHGHPRQLALTLAASAGLALVAVRAFGAALQLPPALAWPIAVIAAVFVTFIASRHFERIADAEAVKLTGDPEALITALARLSNLNHVPIEWGMWAERSLTHPSTLRRAQAIARRAGLEHGRVEALLASLPRPEPRFAVEWPGPDGRVFSTLWKVRTATSMAWIALAIYSVLPAVVVSVLPADHPGAFERVITDVFALLVTAGVLLLLSGQVGSRAFRELRKRLSVRMVEAGVDADRCGGRFVGISPAREPRIYEHFADWDVGWLFLNSRRLCFIGEETRFELSREHITDVTIGEGMPGWIPAPRVVIEWRDDARAISGAVSLRVADGRSMLAATREARALCGRIQSWRRGVLEPHPEPAFDDLGAPPTREVTSVPTRALVSPVTLLRGLVLSALAVAAMASALGLPFDLGANGALDALLAAWGAQVLRWIPWFRAPRRERRAAAETALERAA